MTIKKRARVPGYKAAYHPPRADGNSSCSFDVSGVRVIGDVTVETRGGFSLSRPGDVARQLLGERVIR